MLLRKKLFPTDKRSRFFVLRQNSEYFLNKITQKADLIK